MKKYYLLTPGPTPIPPQVASKESLPILHHRTTEFGEIFINVLDGLKYIFQTKNDVLLLTSSGTGAMEATVVNLLSPQDEAIVASCGVFGNRWEKICNAFGVKVIKINAEWGQCVDPQEIEKKLKENPKVKAIFTTHTETSTGVVNDLKTISGIVKKTDAILVVDAISGLCGQELYMDEWNLDVVVSGSQKGLMSPPGLSFVSLSSKAWEYVSSARLPRFYWDFKKMKESIKNKETPYTPAVSLIVSLSEAINIIKQEGIENIFKRTKRLARATREAIKSINLELFAKETYACDVLTSIKMPENINSSEIVKTLRDEFGVSIADGQEKLKGRIIRIAHMGYILSTDIIVALSCLEVVLEKFGFKVEKGKSVRKFQEIISCTEY